MPRPWRLPLGPVPLALLLVATFVCWAFPFLWPEQILYVNAERGIPRPVSPYEYAPVVLAVVLTLGLVSRLPLFDELGGRRIRVRSVGYSLAIFVVVSVVLLAALLGYPEDGEPPVRGLVVCLNNVLVLAALLQIQILWLGRPIGLVAFVATYLGLIHAQNAGLWPGLQPLAIGYRPDGEIDTDWRPAWVLATVLAALASAYVRRMVPVPALDLLAAGLRRPARRSGRLRAPTT